MRPKVEHHVFKSCCSHKVYFMSVLQLCYCFSEFLSTLGSAGNPTQLGLALKDSYVASAKESL